MITGRHDTYLTLAEFAVAIGREEKTIRNWVSEGRLQFVHLCGVPLISLSMLENLITGVVPCGAENGKLALRLASRTDSRAPRAPNRSLTPSPRRGSVSSQSHG